MILGAIVGIVVLASRNRRPMNQEQQLVWENTRVQGKRRYILGYVLRGSLISLVGLSAMTWVYTQQSHSSASAGRTTRESGRGAITRGNLIMPLNLRRRITPR
jgi:hypothetical protein